MGITLAPHYPYGLNKQDGVRIRVNIGKTGIRDRLELVNEIRVTRIKNLVALSG